MQLDVFQALADPTRRRRALALHGGEATRAAGAHQRHRLPRGGEPYESDITVDFSAVGDTVRMVVTLDPMHSDEFTKMQKEGFTSQLTKLDERFA